MEKVTELHKTLTDVYNQPPVGRENDLFSDSVVPARVLDKIKLPTILFINVLLRVKHSIFHFLWWSKLNARQPH